MYLSKTSEMHSTPLENNWQSSLSAFKLWIERLGYAESTIQSYSLLLSNFFRFLNGSKPTQTKIEAFNEALHKRAIGRRYIANHITVINLYSRYLELSSKQKLI